MSLSDYMSFLALDQILVGQETSLMKSAEYLKFPKKMNHQEKIQRQDVNLTIVILVKFNTVNIEWTPVTQL